MSRFCLFIIIVLLSDVSYAMCPPIVACKVTAEASTIAGSNADLELKMFSQNITKTSTDVSMALSNMSSASIDAQSEGGKSLISAMMEMSQNNLNTTLTVKKALLDAEMTNKVELAENQYKQSISVVAKDDVKEEVDEILRILTKYPDLTVPEIIVITKNAYDKNPEKGFVLVPLKSAEGICAKDDINNSGLCSVRKRAFLGSKLQSFFSRCSLEKVNGITTKKSLQLRKTTIEIVNKKTTNAMETTNTVGAVSNRLMKQQKLSCTPTEFKNRQCQTNITKEDYQEAITIGKIIPGGDISATNFTSPAYSSADGLIDDLPKEVVNEIRYQALDREELIDNPTQKIIPFRYTYKNANQVKSALNFIDNIVSEDLIPNLAPKDRRKVKNAEYQSRFINKMASLSMARLVLTESMSLRIGDKMREMIDDGTIELSDQFNIEPDSVENKERVTGAGLLDILEYKVNKQTDNLRLTLDDNGVSTKSNDFISTPTQSNTVGKILDSIILQNQMLQKEVLMNDQLLSLKAISIAQKVNSNSSILYLKSLREGR